MKNICSNCGQEDTSNAKVCGLCGQDFGVTTATNTAMLSSPLSPTPQAYTPPSAPQPMRSTSPSPISFATPTTRLPIHPEKLIIIAGVGFGILGQFLPFARVSLFGESEVARSIDMPFGWIIIVLFAATLVTLLIVGDRRQSYTTDRKLLKIMCIVVGSTNLGLGIISFVINRAWLYEETWGIYIGYKHQRLYSDDISHRHGNCRSVRR